MAQAPRHLGCGLLRALRVERLLRRRAGLPLVLLMVHGVAQHAVRGLLPPLVHQLIPRLLRCVLALGGRGRGEAVVDNIPARRHRRLLALQNVCWRIPWLGQRQASRLCAQERQK